MLENSSNRDEAISRTELLRCLAKQAKLIEDLQTSTSWRLTAPLRWIGRVLKDLRQPSVIQATVAEPVVNDYAQWIRQFEVHGAAAEANLRQQIDGFAQLPLFSLLLPVQASSVQALQQVLTNVSQQVYPNWELCLALGANVHVDVVAFAQNAALSEPRLKLVHSEKMCTGGSDLSNLALKLASQQSDWLLKINATINIAKNSIFTPAKAVNASLNDALLDLQLMYADEDVLDADGQRSDPFFKCAWNSELHYSRNLIGRFGFYRTRLVRQLGGYTAGLEEVDDTLDFDLSLRYLEKIKPSQIVHLPQVLFHAKQASPPATAEGQCALDAHFARLNIDAKAENLGHGYRVNYALPAPSDLPQVSLIIPTRNGLHLLRQCIDSIQTKTTYPNFDIIIVDNGSDDIATLAYLKSLASTPHVQVLRIDAPFNYSALNNAAVAMARGELVGLLNNDVEVISPDWLDEMVSHALQNGAGAVGARLWFPDNTLQHGGVVLGLGGVAGHAHTGSPKGQIGSQGRTALTQNFSAVTAACLIIKKSIFEEVGGLNEQDLAVAFNDIDFCLRLGEAGYRNVWTPFAELYHHESATRGYEDTPAKQQRFAKEMSYMYQRWGELLLADPAYSPNLTLTGNDFGLAWPPRMPKLEQTVDVQPGVAPLYERLNTMSKGKVRIAYFAENVHSSTYRYRASNMVAVLNEKAVVGEVQTSAACFFIGDLQFATQIVQHADVLVISRARYDPAIADLVQAFQAQNKRVLFDIDDLVFDMQEINLIINTAGQQATDEDLNYWYSVVGRMGQAMALCDGVITTQAYLAGKIKRYSDLTVRISPNFVNAAQLAVSEPLYQQKCKQGSVGTKRIKLGYFSGSATHNSDLKVLSYALERVMAADERIDLVLVGHVDVEQAFGARFGGYLKGHLADRLILHPFVDFVALQELIADVDFNLVPLQVNEFTHSKSELKYVDAAVVGTLTIASPAYAYTQTIRHGENGYLAADDEWESVVLAAIARKDSDLQMHQHMVTSAHQDVYQRFTWLTQRPAILQALGLSK